MTTKEFLANLIQWLRDTVGDADIEKLQMENSMYLNTDFDMGGLTVQIGLPLTWFSDYDDKER